MPPQKLLSCSPQDIGKLPDTTKQILFKHGCDCVSLFENQLGAQDARDNLTSPWGIPLSPKFLTSSSQHSVTATPLSDPNATTTPQTKNPSFFESFCSEHVPWFLEMKKMERKPPTLQCFQKQILSHTKHQRHKLIRESWGVTPKKLQTTKFAAHQKNKTLHYVIYLKFDSIAVVFMHLYRFSFLFDLLVFVWAKSLFFIAFQINFENLFLFLKRKVFKLVLFFFKKTYINQRYLLEKHPTFPYTQKYCHYV